MSPTSYRAAPPRVSEDCHYSKATRPSNHYMHFLFSRVGTAEETLRLPIASEFHASTQQLLQQSYNSPNCEMKRSRMTVTDWTGSSAAALTTIAFLPQAWKVWRTKHTADISLGMYILFTNRGRSVVGIRSYARFMADHHRQLCHTIFGRIRIGDENKIRLRLHQTWTNSRNKAKSVDRTAQRTAYPYTRRQVQSGQPAKTEAGISPVPLSSNHC